MKKYFFSALAFVLLAFGGMRTASAQLHPFNDADTRELQSFRLNDDIVERYRSATLALMEYAKAHPRRTILTMRRTRKRESLPSAIWSAECPRARSFRRSCRVRAFHHGNMSRPCSSSSRVTALRLCNEMDNKRP